MCSVFLSFVHHITAVIFTTPTVSAANHLVVSFDEFLLLQIDPPCVDGGNRFDAPFSYCGSYDHIGWRFRIKAAKLEVFGDARYLNEVANYATMLNITRRLNYH